MQVSILYTLKLSIKLLETNELKQTKKTFINFMSCKQLNFK